MVSSPGTGLEEVEREYEYKAAKTIRTALRKGVGAVGADQHSVPTGPLAALALADEMQTMGFKVGGVVRAQF